MLISFHRNIICQLYNCIEDKNKYINKLQEKIKLLKNTLENNKISYENKDELVNYCFEYRI